MRYTHFERVTQTVHPDRLSEALQQHDASRDGDSSNWTAWWSELNSNFGSVCGALLRPSAGADRSLGSYELESKRNLGR
jgi:hypothetical protein